MGNLLTGRFQVPEYMRHGCYNKDRANPAKETEDEKLKNEYTSYSQKLNSAKNILILNIDPSILIDKCTNSLAKEISDYYLP